jgi:tRNA threonylcarbamoyladenosine biosynthesis protein TsaE
LPDLVSRGVDETLAIGRSLGERVRPGDVVMVEGPLGAGKTVLVKGIAEGLGVDADVISPTFVLVRHYRGRLPLVHADLYRLGSRAEIDALGLLQLSEDGVLVVEWADRAPWLAAPDQLRVTLGLGAEVDFRTIAATDEGPAHLTPALTPPERSS